MFYKIDEIANYANIYNSLNGLIANFKIDPTIVYFHILCAKTDQDGMIKICGSIESRGVIYHPLLSVINNYNHLEILQKIEEMNAESDIVADVCSNVTQRNSSNNQLPLPMFLIPPPPTSETESLQRRRSFGSLLMKTLRPAPK